MSIASSPRAACRRSGWFTFGLRKPMPVWVEAGVLALPRILINGGRRGFLVGIVPAVLADPLGAQPVECAQPADA